MPVDEKGYYSSAVKVITKWAPKIDDGVPIPPGRSPRNDKGYAAVLRELDVGQSVFLPTSRASAYGRTRLVIAESGRNGEAREFTIRRETSPTGVTGHRVWRVA